MPSRTKSSNRNRRTPRKKTNKIIKMSLTKSSNRNRRTPRKKTNKIIEMSLKEYCKTKAYMRPTVKFGSLRDKQCPSKNINIGQPSEKAVNNSVANGISKSNRVREPSSKGMKQPTTSSLENHLISVEKQKALSIPRFNTKAGLKRKGEGNDASRPNHALQPKKIDRLGQYSDSSSSLKKQASSDKDEDITSATYSTTKLEFSKGIHMVPKDSCTTEGNKRQDEVAIDKEKVIKFGEYHKEGDTMKAKHTWDSILSDIHCNSRSISSYPFGCGLPKFQRDNHSMNLTFENVEKREFIESNMGHCNSMSKKRKEPLSEENPRAFDDNDSSVGVQGDNLSCKQMKKLIQSRVTRKDEAEDGVANLNHVGVEDDTASISKNDHTNVLVSSRAEQQCYSCMKPIDKPSWSGIFKTDDKEYASLDGHLSTKSCEKAWSLSRQLLKMVEVKKLSRLEVWPKAWEVSTPTGDDIGIYFFPHAMRQDEGWNKLVREVMENDLALQTIIGEAEMLIFSSILLPIHHQTFQRKHYLWGVFKRREDKGVVVEEPLNAMGRCEKEEQQKVVSDQPNHMLPVEKTNQEMSQMAGSIPLERHKLTTNESTQEVEASHLKGPTKNNGFDLKALGEEVGQAESPLVATDAASFLASHGHITSSMGHTPGRLMGFIVRKTPKLDRIILEMEQEGALVFAMQGEMVGAGSWAGSKAPSTQN